MEKLMEILEELRPDVDFGAETALVDDAILDSFDIVTLVGELNDAFQVEIPFEEMEPENFNSADAIYQLIEKLRQGA